MTKNNTAVQILDEVDWFKLEPRSLYFERTPTFEEWETIAGQLKNVKGSLPFWIGDWMRNGETAFGEQYIQIADIFGNYEYGTISNYKYVMERVLPPERHNDLSFSHHYAVANLEAEEQRFWLDKAFKKDWPADILRYEIKIKNFPTLEIQLEVVEKEWDKEEHKKNTDTDKLVLLSDKIEELEQAIEEERVNTDPIIVLFNDTIKNLDILLNTFEALQEK